MSPNLTAEQLLLIGFIASALVIFFRLVIEVMAKMKLQLSDLWMRIIVYVVSGGVAYLWFPPAVPPLPDFFGEFPGIVVNVLDFAARLFTVLSVFFVVAHSIYELLLRKVKNAIGAVLLPRLYKKSTSR